MVIITISSFKTLGLNVKIAAEGIKWCRGVSLHKIPKSCKGCFWFPLVENTNKPQLKHLGRNEWISNLCFLVYSGKYAIQGKHRWLNCSVPLFLSDVEGSQEAKFFSNEKWRLTFKVKWLCVSYGYCRVFSVCHLLKKTSISNTHSKIIFLKCPQLAFVKKPFFSLRVFCFKFCFAKIISIIS